MSQSVDLRWQLEARRRREAYLNRLSDNAEKFAQRHQVRFDSLVEEGLERFMPREFAALRADLGRLESLVDADPEEARDLSFEVGAMLSRLPALARNARREFEARERERQRELEESRRQAASELAQHLHGMISSITDPIELDFAFDGIRRIQAESQCRTIEAGQLDAMKSDLEARFRVIRDAARAQAEEWRRDQSAATARDASEALVEMYREQIADGPAMNQQALDEMLGSLEAIRGAINGATVPERILGQIVAAAKKIDESTVDEDCRRVVVRGIVEALEQSGFVVARPRRNASGEVVILARRPAGNEAAFTVADDGGMRYKFEHYEGMQCKGDLDKVLPMLQDIYGVTLSDERVLWQNPDGLSASARPLDDNNTGRSNG